jgi:hypothetical protein
LNRKCANSQRKNFPIKKSYRSTDNRERGVADCVITALRNSRLVSKFLVCANE